mgnify:FL=1
MPATLRLYGPTVKKLAHEHGISHKKHQKLICRSLPCRRISRQLVPERKNSLGLGFAGSGSRSFQALLMQSRQEAFNPVNNVQGAP